MTGAGGTTGPRPALNPAVSALVDALSGLLPAERPIHLHEPQIGEREKALVMQCLDSGFVSSVGTFVDEFERRVADVTGATHAVAVANGTAALEIALHLAGVAPADEVVMPALTFVGTANAAAHLGAAPHFVDSSRETLGMCPDALRRRLLDVAIRESGETRNRVTGARISAIVPVHVYGHPCEMADIMDVADRFGIPVVEDAAESLGSRIGNRHTGTLGRLGTFSFNGNKVITTGGGGIVVTDDPDLAQRARHLSTTGKAPHPWRFDHDAIAWNYRMPNLNAALGCAQLEGLPGMLTAKRRLADRYAAAFGSDGRLRFVTEPAGTTSNYWLCTVELPAGVDIEDALSALHEQGFLCRPTWTPLSQLPMYLGNQRGALTTTEELARTLVNLPSSAHLAESVET